MDLVTLAFYALVCGVLGFAGPYLGSPLRRLGIGAVVGLIAAALLPFLRIALGF